jgi:two-component system CheB/CheR fusion protein
MADGELVVSPNTLPEQRRAPIDIFFHTLADAHGGRGVCVVLSGSGSDGSLGLRRVKERGGVVFVQNPREAAFSEMPRSAIATDLVDDVVPVAEIPARIAAYRDGLATTTSPVVDEQRPKEQVAEAGPQPPERIAYGGLHQRLLEQYAPPSVVVNQEFAIVHLSDHAGRYLQIAGGELASNVLALVRPELRAELRVALSQALQHQANVEARNLPLRIGDHTELVSILVRPVLRHDDPAQGFLLILFEPGSLPASDAEPVMRADEPAARQLEEEEVLRLRRQLRSSSEQYELQALNEELHTSKEEQPSINEELRTLNQELKIKIDEATQAGANLHNLVNSTDIGTIFLDRGLRIKLFTPAARALFNLLPADLGRPLSDLAHQLLEVDVLADAETVLARLQTIEREVRATDGRTFVMRALPYRAGKDQTGGVVLTFFDISERTRVARALAEQARLLDLSNDAIIVRDVHNRILYWNRGASELYGWTREEAIGQDLHTLLKTEFEAPLAKLVAVLHERERMEGEVVQVARDGRRITLLCRWALDRDPQGRPGSILTTYNDITERKRMEQALRESERDFRAIFEGSSVGKAQVDPMTRRFLRVNAALCAITGYTEAELLALTVDDLTRPDDRERDRELFDRLVQGKASYQLEKRYVRNDGRLVWVTVTGNVIQAADGQPVRTVAVIQDITARKRAEEALRVSEAKYRTLFETMDEGFCILQLIFDAEQRPTDYR